MLSNKNAVFINCAYVFLDAQCASCSTQKIHANIHISHSQIIHIVFAVQRVLFPALKCHKYLLFALSLHFLSFGAKF